MDKKISIIIPVYNVENYLDRCIKSVLEQTYKYWELILIDDGSTDSSGLICDNYKSIDDRICVIHTKNKGRSAARNLGIKKSNGEWIVFIDSDDFVGVYYLEAMVKANISWDDKLLVNQGFHAIRDSGEKDVNYNEAYYDNIEFNYKNANVLISRYSLLHRQAVWGRLFNAQIIKKNNIYFHTAIHHCEDGLFLHQYMLLVNSFKFISSQEYYYVTPCKQQTPIINYEEFFYLAFYYEHLHYELIKHFRIKNNRYKKRIIDMYQNRLYCLLFDKKCPLDYRRKAEHMSIKFIFYRPILELSDIKLIIKYFVFYLKYKI